MPIYEYECNQCREPFEKIVPLSDADKLPACPECGSEDTRKKISALGSFGISGLGAASSSAGDCGTRAGFT